MFCPDIVYLQHRLSDVVSLDFVGPRLSHGCRADSYDRTHTFCGMKPKNSANHALQSVTQKAKSKARTTRRGEREIKDEPDAFRRAVERWTLRSLLIAATIVLASELLPWTVQKVRQCVRETMHNNSAQCSMSISGE